MLVLFCSVRAGSQSIKRQSLSLSPEPDNAWHGFHSGENNWAHAAEPPVSLVELGRG